VEGTTLSYELVRRHAKLGPPTIILLGPRKQQQLAIARRTSYFGFDLETDIEPLSGRIPDELLVAAHEALAAALLDGQTAHPDQGRIRRAAGALREWWLRSGGRVQVGGEAALRARVAEQLSEVHSWKDFLDASIRLEPEALVPEGERQRLDSLPGMVRLHGDAVPLHYEVDGAGATVRLQLREGQARRLRPYELPELDRPLRFEVIRDDEPPIRAETLDELQRLLRHSSRRAPVRRQSRRQPRRGGRRR
jgi:hypothetical protein